MVGQTFYLHIDTDALARKLDKSHIKRIAELETALRALLKNRVSHNFTSNTWLLGPVRGETLFELADLLNDTRKEKDE